MNGFDSSYSNWEDGEPRATHGGVVVHKDGKWRVRRRNHDFRRYICEKGTFMYMCIHMHMYPYITMD